MNPTLSRILSHTVALLIGSIAALLYLAPDRAELANLRKESDAWADAIQRAEKLQAEFTSLRNQYDELASRMPKANELAKLRADSAELKRLKAEQNQTPNPNRQPPSLPPIPHPPEETAPEVPAPAPLSMNGNIPMNSTDTVITGGWEIEPGQRAFVLATPTLLDDGTVLIETKLVSIPDASVSELGLNELLSNANHSELYAVTPADEAQALNEAFQHLAGINVLSAPRLTTLPGRQGQISDGRFKIDILPYTQPNSTSINLTLIVEVQPTPQTPQQ
ncbi:MAG: hypothetical protein ACO34E_03990 [Limisphaerales bacterium]